MLKTVLFFTGLALAWVSISLAADRPDLGAAGVDAGQIEWVFSRPAGIAFSKTEVTVRQYRACVQAGQCKAPLAVGHCNWGRSDRDAHPINCVDWHQATALCSWAGGRLPTDAEWLAEASAKGKRPYPWGEAAPSCERAIWSQGGNGCGRNDTWPVCSKPAGNSLSGLCNLSGNVWEWTNTKAGSAHRLRGGSWDDEDPAALRASSWYQSAPGSTPVYNGIRCVRPAKDKKMP